MKGENWTHQALAIATYKAFSWFALLFDCGTGKTRTFIGVVEAKEDERGEELPVIVICPKNIIRQWKDAIETHSDHENTVFAYLDTDCTTKKKKEAFKEAFDKFLSL